MTAEAAVCLQEATVLMRRQCDEVETCDGLQSYNCSAAERLREQEPKTMRRNHQPVYTWHQHASSNHKSAARSGINTLKTH